jgi:hemoglobin-like flavoprotein
MSLTKEEENIITSQWNVALKDPESTAKLFYSHLFESFPEVRNLFKTNDFVEQGRKLINMITGAVKKVEKLDSLNGNLEKLGRLHVTYGVKPEHYPIVGSNLLWTLETALGSQWNEESKKAWSKFYDLVAQKMIKGHLTENKTVPPSIQNNVNSIQFKTNKVIFSYIPSLAILALGVIAFLYKKLYYFRNRTG